ncbi:MAG: hypothetical protein FWJ83_03990 [Limnochordales bacterium]
MHKVAAAGRFSLGNVETSSIKRARKAARNGGAMQVRVIAIDFRLDPSVRRLARSFSRLTGVPLARLLAPELEPNGHGPEQFS